MGRCKKDRCCREIGGQRILKPAGQPMHTLEQIIIELDEFEALRLCDHENKNQIEAAEIMKVSRGTLQRILQKGRYKIINALLNGKALIINNK